MSSTIKEIKQQQEKLTTCLADLIQRIGKVNIGKPEQFPYGWRKAAKGRTVWRIVEELITQNLENKHTDIGIDAVEPSDSEVSVYDMKCTVSDLAPMYINIKSAVSGRDNSKDDISKGEKLKAFYDEDPSRDFFVATFFIKFNEDMSIEIDGVSVFPIAWLKTDDIYVNPSNNGNLQAKYYKDIAYASKRTNKTFIPLLSKAIKAANKKKADKQKAKEKAAKKKTK